MQKKIKDLTLGEIAEKIKCCKKGTCKVFGCPFAKYDSCLFFSEIYNDLERKIKI